MPRSMRQNNETPPHLRTFCECLAGVGIVLAQTDVDTCCEVDKLIKGSPAHACGMIQPGNKLLFVNGSDVSKTTMKEIVEKILGPSGTVVGKPALQFMLYFLRDLIFAHFF
jgi:C-terminal processing protease CtpA/Prc